MHKFLTKFSCIFVALGLSSLGFAADHRAKVPFKGPQQNFPASGVPCHIQDDSDNERTEKSASVDHKLLFESVISRNARI